MPTPEVKQRAAADANRRAGLLAVAHRADRPRHRVADRAELRRRRAAAEAAALAAFTAPASSDRRSERASFSAASGVTVNAAVEPWDSDDAEVVLYGLQEHHAGEPTADVTDVVVAILSGPCVGDRSGTPVAPLMYLPGVLHIATSPRPLGMPLLGNHGNHGPLSPTSDESSASKSSKHTTRRSSINSRHSSSNTRHSSSNATGSTAPAFSEVSAARHDAARPAWDLDDLEVVICCIPQRQLIEFEHAHPDDVATVICDIMTGNPLAAARGFASHR
jgi:hypothetical protein